MVMVGAVVDAAIGWLVQSILENLFSAKLKAWTRGVGLEDDVETLQSDLRYVRIVVAAAKGRKIESEALVQSLVDLKQLLYDAEDVMDKLDYYSLQEQVTSGSGTNSAVRNTGTPSTSSSGSLLQIGSNIISKISSLSAPISSGKRKREDGHSAAGTSRVERKIEHDHKNIASDTQQLANMSLRMKDIAGKLRRLGTDVVGILQIIVPNSYGISDLSQSTPSDARVTISHLSESKVYGRDTELEFILKQIPSPQEKGKQDLMAHIKPFTRREKMASNECGGITVVPIVGVGGVGKTTLAQLVYNDPKVGSRFDIKMWVCVTDEFNLPKLTRDMLGYVDDQKQSQICSLDKLQKDLSEKMKSKRFLIVLDDVWNDSMTMPLWNNLLAPLKSAEATGSMILVTTRESSVAEMTRTVEPVKLGALEENDFWLLFKSCVFGDEESEEHLYLHTIGKQIALQLRGNPLAAKTVGALLGSNISMASWTNIRDNEEWKSLQYSNGIMPALKLSYDYLLGHLQQCFRYCCLFPKGYRFDGAELARIWISQGFVHHSNTGKTLEDTGKVYLADLVKSGFFQQVERDWSSLDFRRGGDTEGLFVMHDLMHDLAWEVSRADFATINGSDCEDIRTTTRHLSIVTDSAYNGNDPRGNTFSQENFDEKLKKVTSSVVKKLRSLVLIGYYEAPFFKDFSEMFKEVENLRLLQISATYTDFVSFLQNLEHHAHLRYLKLENKRSVEDLSIPLGKFYHLQVLDVGRPTIPSSMMKDLVRMRYLVLRKAKHVTRPDYNGFEMLQSMNDLVHLGVYQLENISRAEADGAKLRDKRHLETLHLSWKDALSQDDYDSNSSSENHSNSSPEDYGNTSSQHYTDAEPEESWKDALSQDDYDSNSSSENHSNSSPEDYGNTSSQHYTDAEPEEENCPINGANNILTFEQFTDTAKEVLEGLEPHRNLKHLRISGYSGATSPNWFSSDVPYTCLQTLHLEDCGEWQALPSLEERLPYLTKLKLRNMSKVTQLSIPPLEELVLIDMIELERCSCNSIRDLNSSLRVLMIERCDVLEAFPLFESCEKFRIKHNSWLPGLSELTIYDCPGLIVSNPLPPSSRACKLSISRVLTLPNMEGSSSGELRIGDVDGLTKLDEVFSFHNLRVLTHLEIAGCKNLSFVSLKGFKQLISLNSLEIDNCEEFFSSDVLPEHALEEMETANFNAFPTLKHLSITSNNNPNKISGKWLSVMLRHAPVLEELHLDYCGEISGLLIEGKESCLSNHSSSPRASSPGNPDDASTSSTREGLVHIPSNLVSSLKKLSFWNCYALTFLEKKASFSAFTSLEELQIWGCPKLISSFEPKDENSDHANGGCLLPYSPSEPGIIELEPLEKLQLCPRMSLNCLKKLDIFGNENLESLKLDSYTNLEELIIAHFGSLTALEGLQSLRGLRYLEVRGCPGLPPFVECLSGQVSELFPGLERLCINDYSFLTRSFCMHLASLQLLVLHTLSNKAERLTREQDRALHLVTSLQDLKFSNCWELVDLPVCLHSLSSVKRLRIIWCQRISRLPEKGLPPSLEELEIWCCSEELTSKCRMLATSMLKVKIDGHYVN